MVISASKIGSMDLIDAIIEGYTHAQWILLDYANIMVHVFQEPFRRLYDLESLWADGRIYNIDADI